MCLSMLSKPRSDTSPRTYPGFMTKPLVLLLSMLGKPGSNTSPRTCPGFMMKPQVLLLSFESGKVITVETVEISLVLV